MIKKQIPGGNCFSASFPGPARLKCEQNEKAEVGLDKGEP